MKKSQKPKDITTLELAVLLGRVMSIHPLFGFQDDGNVTSEQRKHMGEAATYFAWWAECLKRENREGHVGLVEKAVHAMFTILGYNDDGAPKRSEVCAFLVDAASTLRNYETGRDTENLESAELEHFVDAALLLLSK